MAYFTSLWKSRIIEKYKREYEDEKINSILASNTEIPRKTTSMMQKWRIYRRDTKTRMTGKLKKWFPEGSSVSNLYYYMKRDQTFPNFVLKSIIGFLGGVVLTYLCFMFFVFQLSISLMHATIMSSVIGVLLTIGLAFSYRIRCLVFLVIPQLFSRVGRYTLTCYALVLILTGPATNTFKNSEILSESMACSQEQIKTSVKQINEAVQKPFNALKDSIKIIVGTMKRSTFALEKIISRISILATSISEVIQSSLSWLESVGGICNQKFGTPYDYCVKAIDRGVFNYRKTFRGDLWWLRSTSSAAKTACLTVRPYTSVCFIADYATTSFAATMRRKQREFTERIKKMLFINVETQHTYTFTSNASDSASQVAAGIVTEIRKRADPLLTWLSWSSCVTSLFLLLIIFRAKYYQHMFETRSRFDNRYVTQELRELDLQRYLEGRETILPLNKREQAKYITVTSFRLVTTEKLHVTRSMVFMTITTFKLLIHIIADYSLYWVLMTIRYHGQSQTTLSPGPSDAGVQISGHGIVADFIRSIFDSLTIPLVPKIPSPVTCLPNPYPPDLQRYTQIAVLIMLLWFFALFEPYGLRLRHVVMGHYRPERAKTRAVWLYNHILRTRGSFMKLARRKLHREYKYSDQENLTFRHLVNSILPCRWLRYMFGTLPKDPRCFLCNTIEEGNYPDTKLISCKTPKCPGTYCARCYCDIGNLCTICLSPEDYGDMSDISLEKGSSDDSSDTETENNGHYYNKEVIKYARARESKNDEREKLIKKSDKYSKKNCRKYREDKKVQDKMSLDEEIDDDVIASPRHYAERTVLINKIKRTKKVIFKELTYLSKIQYIKLKTKIAHNNFHMYMGWCCSRKYSKPYDKYVKSNDYIDCTNFNICKRHRKPLRQKKIIRKYHSSIPLFKVLQSVNFYDIKIVEKSIYVSKIKIHSIKSKRCKRGYSICIQILKDINQSSLRQTNSIKTIFLAGRKYTSCKIKNEKRKNKINIEINSLTNNIGSNDSIENKNLKIFSGDENLYNKGFRENKRQNQLTKNKHSFRVQKIYNLCWSCIKTNNTTPSKEESKSCSCCCFKDTANFKSRKKAKEKGPDRSVKNHIAKEETVNARNYRLSSYMLDQNWIWQKLCKDPSKERMTKLNVLCDIAKLRLEAADHQDKEARLMKVLKQVCKHTSKVKVSLNTPKNKVCHCPTDVCICQQKPTRNEKRNQFKNVANDKKKSPDFPKKYCCKYVSSEKTASKPENTHNVDYESLTEGGGKYVTESLEDHLARRLNFYTSLGNNDFKADKIPEIGVTCTDELKKLRTESSVASNFISSSKSNMSKHSQSRIFDKDWLSTTIKSMRIKDIKIALSERFLHLRMKNPLPMMKNILLQAALKMMQRKHADMQKATEEKGVTVLPIVKNRSRQFLNEKISHKDRNTQIYKKSDQNTTQPIKSSLKNVKEDAEVEVIAPTSTGFTQYRKSNRDKTCSCMKINKNTKDFGDTAKVEACFSDISGSEVTLSTISLTDIKTDRTVCSRLAIDYEASPRRAKSKKNIRKIRVEVITKANQGTLTDRAKLCDVSTVTSDWWTPILEKKLGKEHFGRGEIMCEKKYKDKSVATDGRIVTFNSHAQIISTDTSTGDILSPSRYLLESQKYYNELFSSKFNSPRIYPVNVTGSRDFKKHWSLDRKGRKTKRLTKKHSPRLKLSKSNIEKIR